MRCARVVSDGQWMELRSIGALLWLASVVLDGGLMGGSVVENDEGPPVLARRPFGDLLRLRVAGTRYEVPPEPWAGVWFTPKPVAASNHFLVVTMDAARQPCTDARTEER